MYKKASILRYTVRSRLIITVLSFILLMSVIFYPNPIFVCSKRISDNRNEELGINNIDIPITSLDVAVRGSYAYLVREYSFSYYNLNAESGPEFVGYLDNYYEYYNRTFDDVNQIEIRDNNMFIFSTHGSWSPINGSLYITEFENESSLEILGTVSINATHGGPMYYWIQNLVVEDNFVYIGTTWLNTTYEDRTISLISIIDYSNKSKPFEIGRYISTDMCNEIAVDNDRLFFITTTQQAYNLTDHSTYEIGENKLEVLDISNKSQPIRVQKLSLEEMPSSIIVENDLLFLAYYGGSLEIYNVSDVLNPALLTSYKFEARKLVKEDNHLYVLENDKLVIYDATDHRSLKKIGEKKVRFRGENSRFIDCTIDGNLVLAVRQVQYYGTFIIFDCTNLKYPKIIYPEVDSNALRLEITIIVFGYVISPMIFLSIFILVIRIQVKKKQSLKKESVSDT